jgi:hypothetical protein
VKFWIYGGADDAGAISDPLYNGCNLATDSILVSAAYRLGALGFLSVEIAGINGNFTVQDLLLALQWVQANIAAFGGDSVRIPEICFPTLLTADSTNLGKGARLRLVCWRRTNMDPELFASKS